MSVCVTSSSSISTRSLPAVLDVGYANKGVTEVICSSYEGITLIVYSSTLVVLRVSLATEYSMMHLSLASSRYPCQCWKTWTQVSQQEVREE
jgi:hypothetical protein